MRHLFLSVCANAPFQFGVLMVAFLVYSSSFESILANLDRGSTSSHTRCDRGVAFQLQTKHKQVDEHTRFARASFPIVEPIQGSPTPVGLAR